MLATLISEELGVELGLARPYTRLEQCPVYNTAFNYPQDTSGVPGNDLSAASMTVSQALADRVAAGAAPLAIMAPS